MKQLGAEVDIQEGYVVARAGRLRGTRIVTDMVTVTGTENLVMAAVLAEGVTVIENAAREPEVIDLCQCLNAMGAKIEGAGTSHLTIEGVKALHGAEHTVIADRIEAGSFFVAAVVTQGDILVTHCEPHHMDAVLDKLREAGATLDVGQDWVRVRMTGRPKPVSIRTAPHPGFPTDMQAQFMTMNCFAEGTSSVTETIFENRFMHVPELMRLGARIAIDGHTAVVEGVQSLTGATIMATDLRASASLVIAALAAKGTSTVDRIYHLDRGYERMEEKLRALGADIVRVQG
ncbi:UDP-N-acetylglucosamine 1-carboxyvinyltransferase [gut metagenome]|uniref:UDP-N-acetylglucosamine 1-carboxyvinyltransferase n=1 Tax=gut metagenome TaxID=749906 RepID=J9GGR6_9ZZZZ